MPLYEFKCKTCDADIISQRPIEERDIPLSLPCPNCSAHTIKRKFGFSFKIDTFDPYLIDGQPVSSERDHKQRLNQKADEEEQRTGIRPEYTTFDSREAAANPEWFGITDDGMKSTHDTAVAEGTKSSKGQFVFQI